MWRRKEGGYLARGRVKDPRTNKLREVKLTLPDVDAAGAYRELQAALVQIREGRKEVEQTRPSFGEFAASLLERKVKRGDIKSAKGRQKWAYMLELHLLPFFGAMLVDEIRRADVLRWLDGQAAMVTEGKVLPGTVNDRLSTLKTIINAAVAELELERNPVLGVKDLDTSVHPTYTEEQPNSLLAQEVPVFLAMMRELHPQHFALVALGFATGLRPSSLRPLRRQGETPDILWEEGGLLVRRSHTRKQEVMPTTKTKRHQRLALPEEMMAILKWHVEHLPWGPQRDSELLFPSETGGFRSESVLQKPFKNVCDKLKLKKKITPKAMRRTFQDLARAAEVKDVVTRAISGHVTEVMQRHYSTVNPEEVRSGIAEVVSLAQAREALERRVKLPEFLEEGSGGQEEGPGGVHGGVHGPEKTKSVSGK